MCKRCCKQGFHLSEHFQKTLYCEKDRRFQVSCQPSGRQTNQHHSSERSVRSVRTSPLYREGSIQLASVRTFQQHVRTPLSTRSVSNFFQSSKKGKINQSSKRCGIPSGRVSALVRTPVLLIWKLPIRLQPSGRLPFMVRTHALQLWKLRVEELPSGRSSPMVRTCKALFGNYLQRKCNRPDVSVSSSRRCS
jgi:hypothetical protein